MAEEKDTKKKGDLLSKKLYLIMKEVDRINKDANNSHQNYKYASEQMIKETLHQALVKYKVLFQLETGNPRVIEKVTWIDCKYTFRDAENPEDTITGSFLGSGQSRDEKGHYASITGAIKYILTSFFLIPTGDDPEKDQAPKNGQPF